MKNTLYLLLISFIIFSCKDDEFIGENINTNIPEQSITDTQFAQDNFGVDITANFIGRIVNVNGTAIKNVQITIGNEVTMTDHNGVFVLNNASVYEKFAYIKASKIGYINGSRTITPTPNGTNDIQITLLEKNIAGTVSSGVPSEVSLPNGSKVEFQGAFIDVNGNPYNGQVAVSIHYLEPNKEATFGQMPGMLFGKRESGVASAMETYGMLAVNLYSPSGEQLNIAETSPATLTFPVATSTPSAPENIALWYFDEEVGYWKEQGIATKIGNEYVAEVSHFSWWNCDLPLEYVNVCFTVSSNLNLSSLLVRIIRNSTNQVIFTGFTNTNGQECGLFPKGEEVTVEVYGSNTCISTLIYSETIGSFTSDSLIDINVSSLPPELVETTMTGTINNCNGAPVNNGYAFLYSLSSNNFSDYDLVPITSGIINHSFVYCNGEEYRLIIYDLEANQASEISSVTPLPNETDLGILEVCGNEVGATHNGDMMLNSQEQVNTFSLYGYNSITGSLRIGVSGTPSDITDISSLNLLTSIGSYLRVYDNPSLSSLVGLENITEITYGLVIKNNDALTSLQGLENVTTIDVASVGIEGNDALMSLQGLDNLTTIGGSLFIYNNASLTTLQNLGNLNSIADKLTLSTNPQLTSLQGLENIISLGDDLGISGSPLTSLQGLNNVTSIGGGLSISGSNLISLQELSNLTSVGESISISHNSQLSSLQGLENITSISDNLYLSNNDALVSLQGTENVVSIGGYLYLYGNDSLTSLQGLINVNAIGGYLKIDSNDSLSSIQELESLISLGGYLDIHRNTSLSSLEGLGNLTVVNGYLSIKNNDALSTLQGLNSLTTIGGVLSIFSENILTSLQGLENVLTVTGNIEIGKEDTFSSNAIGNSNLTNFCALENLFINGTHGNVYIQYNGYNPTVVDMQTGNCSN